MSITTSRIPDGFSLFPLVGEFATQICVGQFDIQIDFNVANILIKSPIKLMRNKVIIGSWDEGLWPSKEFYHLMNNKITDNQVTEKKIEIIFEDELKMIIEFNETYESVLIKFKDSQLLWVI